MDLSNYGDKILWIDTETTGVNTQVDDIIQVACMCEVAGKVDDRVFDEIIQPAVMDPDAPTPGQLKALGINGITLDQLHVAPENHKAFKWFQDYLSLFVQKMVPVDKLVVAGYNVRFDSDMLRAWWNRRNDRYYGSFFYPYVVDVMGMVTEYLAFDLPLHVKRPDNLRLGTILKWAGIDPGGDLHDAMVDIKATRELFYWLRMQRHMAAGGENA